MRPMANAMRSARLTNPTRKSDALPLSGLRPTGTAVTSRGDRALRLSFRRDAPEPARRGPHLAGLVNDEEPPGGRLLVVRRADKI